MRKLLLLFVFVPLLAFSQAQRKQITINRCSTPPAIDAIIDDDVWKSATTINDFIQQSPRNGAVPSEKSQVRITYNDDALYVAAILYDTQPDSIFTGFGSRDAGDELNADLFSIEINPYHDRRSAFEFMVSASGIQMDSQNTIDAMNKNWDAVWESKVNLTSFGWVVEMRIPFSAIRFPQANVQCWEMNLFRLIKRKGEGITWNFVNKEVYGWLNQAGDMVFADSVEPAMRLSFTPYISGYMNKDYDENNYSPEFRGGLDLKYGLNQSFTLDMMLIPDFGQVKTDDKSLNTSPFETYYDEKRSFFTEGTEIFNKGNIFYSRRLGGKPDGYDYVYERLDTNEVVSENPVETKLLNATKVSGRTKSGLGVGFINAVSSNTYVEIHDTLTGKKRKINSQPSTNYSMFVLDQSLGKQSFISFANTNKYIQSTGHFANVTASEFKFTNRNEVYAISGNGAFSYIDKETEQSNGYRWQLQIAKVKGKFLFEVNSLLLNNRFNPNDMGYLESNNKILSYAKFEYNIFSKFWNVNELHSEVVFNYKRHYKPSDFSDFDVYAQTKATFSNLSYLMFEVDVTPISKYDYDEPRVAGWKYKEPSDYYLALVHGSDGRKPFSMTSRIAYWQASSFNKSSYWFSITPKVRFSDKVSLSMVSSLEKYLNSLGYAGQSDDLTEIYFVNRDNMVVTNLLEWQWMVNQYHALSLSVRHYWSEFTYKECYKLNSDGSMNANTAYINHNHINYNAFNFYLGYSWEFSPGSRFSLVWKNDVETCDKRIDLDYFDNAAQTFRAPMNSSISFCLNYYIDYQKLRH